jgi:hypothetical protein
MNAAVCNQTIPDPHLRPALRKRCATAPTCYREKLADRIIASLRRGMVYTPVHFVVLKKIAPTH